MSAVPALPVEPPPGTAPPVPHPDALPPGSELPPHYDQCFGCGPEHPSGLRMRVTVGDGVAVHGVFRVTGDHQGAPGLAHGGVIATAFDEVLGFLMWLVGKPAVTGRLETDFRKPVPVGTELHIAARCLGVDGRKIYCAADGRLDAADGPVAARAAALFVAVPVTHFVEHGGAAAKAAHERSYNP